MNALTRVLFAITIVAIGASAHAVVIPLYDPAVIGNGNVPDDGLNLSFDTSTDFEWLDLSLSTSMSYNNMIAQLGPGGLFDGFQHASNADVLQLWTNLGLPTGSFPTFSNASDAGALADAAIDLLSDTGTTASFRFTQGTSTDVTTPANHRVLTVRHDLPATVSTTAGNGGLGDATAGGQIGHWLYRDRSPVPEPSTLAILGTAIAAVSAIRRRRRHSPC
jgi:hypothetical protein